MSVDGYMEKHAYPSIDSRAFNNYMASNSNNIQSDKNFIRNHYKSTDNLINTGKF